VRQWRNRLAHADDPCGGHAPKVALRATDYNPFAVVIIRGVAGRVTRMAVVQHLEVISLAPGQIKPVLEFRASIDAT